MVRRRILTVLLIFLFCGSSGSAQNLFAVISADTLDESIGTSVKKDLDNFQDLVKRVAGLTGLKLTLTVIEGKDFNQTKLTRAIQGVNPGPDDTVVFYNSSHGYRLKAKTSKWPTIYVPDGDGLDEDWVYQTLAAKKPRLLLVLADVCNVVADEDDSIPNVTPRSTANSEKQNYTLLFAKTRGGILASSSKPGQASLAYESGGAFSINFLNSLKSVGRSSASPLWLNIMETSMKSINKGEEDQQDPQYAFYNLQEGAKTATTVAATPTTSPTPTQTAPAAPAFRSFTFTGGKLEEKAGKNWKLTLDKKAYDLKEYKSTQDQVYFQGGRKVYFVLDLTEKALYFYDQKTNDWAMLVNELR